jgi:dihydroorotase
MRTISGLDWRGPSEAGVDLVIRQARVLDPRAGLDERRDVVVRAGALAELAPPGEAELADAEVIEAGDLCLVPAFFDPHVHLRTPGREDEEDLETGTRAAAAGGYCGIVGMANTEPPVDTAEAVEALRERAGREACVPTGFLACATRGMRGDELTNMVELRIAGALGFSHDGLPISSARVLRRALQYQRIAGGLLVLHEEEPELSGGGVMHEGEVSAALGLAGIPAVSESTMVARDCALAAFEGARIHVQHLSARESLAAVAAAKDAGVTVTCEATPHHLALTDEEVRSLDAAYKMNPPLRSEGDRQALVDGLRSGTIDCVGTDHAPHSIDEKEVPFEAAAMGVTGLETAFAALHTALVVPGAIELALLVERMSAGAACLGFDPPRIEPGAEANLALLDLEAEWVPGAEGWESRSVNCAFAGRTLRGRVMVTVVGGRIVYRNRAFALGVAS